VQTKTSQENSQFSDCHEFLYAKRQGGEGDAFLKKNEFIALVTYKILYKIITLPQRVRKLVRNFDNMAWIRTDVFGNITSISEIVIASLGAKGLCLHKSSRARSFSSKSIAVTLKKEPG
jgi:hypothetical protein